MFLITFIAKSMPKLLIKRICFLEEIKNLLTIYFPGGKSSHRHNSEGSLEG